MPDAHATAVDVGHHAAGSTHVHGRIYTASCQGPWPHADAHALHLTSNDVQRRRRSGNRSRRVCSVQLNPDGFAACPELGGAHPCLWLQSVVAQAGGMERHHDEACKQVGPSWKVVHLERHALNVEVPRHVAEQR